MRLLPFIALLAALNAGACANRIDRLEAMNAAPPMTPIQDPSVVHGRQPVMLPMPARATPDAGHSNSLWRTGARSFFDDPRASQVGDILTIEIAIDDDASVSNSTNRSRTSNADAGVDALLGFENVAGQVLFPGGFSPSTAVDFDSSSASTGSGAVDRSESVNLTVAAMITQVLPNGNFIVAGRQEVRINHEVRELLVSGVVRPEDVTAANTIRHTQIAEARISYGGRGTISAVQSPRWGQRAVDAVYPF